MASYKTVYARITPNNGVANEKYSVSVTGVTATVDGQKTWTSGAMNFAITPTSAGTMTVTFKNDTLNQIIGSRVIGIGSDTYGYS
jgi:Flp pilus assembly protein TadG